MNFRLAAVEVPEENLDEQVSDSPPACSYCGGSSFEPPEDNGRTKRTECEECGGTMISHDGGYWQPDLIGSPHNHPRGNGDPNSGGVPGVWAPVLRREDVTRTATIVEPVQAALDPELRLHMVATWADVRNKAKRIRSEGGVHIVVASHDGIGGNVQGDTGVYETLLSYRPGSFKISAWECGCAWAAYAFQRSPAFKRFEGRMCSHALAMQFEAQARGMFGKTVTEDNQRPDWLRDQARQRYLPDTGEHVLVNAKRDPDGLFEATHGLDLLRPPAYAFAVTALSQGHDAAEALRALTCWGLEHAAARALVREALLDPMARTAAAHCPDCGSPVPPDAEVCPHCHAELGGDDAGLHTAGLVRSDDVASVFALAKEHVQKALDQDAPTHAGLALKAGDTGRVLMLQRSHKDEDDPARGRWEFPGGGIEPHDHNSLHGAMREFAEEVGQPVPPGGTLQHVHRSGPYVLHTMVIPSEDAITLHDGRVVPNPDDPKGDDAEQAAWWDPEHAQKNPALREECKSSPWKQIKEASRGLQTRADYAAGDPLSGVQPNDPPAYAEPNIPGTEENPASTGFATGADPAAFRDAGQPNFSLPQSTSTLHDEPEPALPSTDGADDDMWDTYVDPAHQHVPLAETTGRPDPTDAMDSDASPAESLTPNQVRASKTSGVDAIVQQFQATAGGKLLVSGSSDDRSIAEAARAHLSKTALKDFTPSEQAELIGEGAGTRARNFGDLVIEGTHYENLAKALEQYDNPDDVLIV